MFKGKVATKEVCSDKIAKNSLDIFSGAKLQIENGIQEIEANRQNRISVQLELENQLNAVVQEIRKDETNIETLKNKAKALDSLI